MSRPLSVVTASLDGEVLKVLARANVELTSGLIHRQLQGPSARGIINVLNRLTAQGMVERKSAGRGYIYRLNREHLAAAHVIALAHQEEEFIRRCHAIIKSWTISPEFAALFGSVIRKNHSTASDIDIFIVEPDGHGDEDAWLTQLDELRGKVPRWTGNNAQIFSRLRSMVEANIHTEPVLIDIARSHVHLFGDPVWLMRLSASRSREGTKERHELENSQLH